MPGFIRRHWRKALILPPIAIAVAVFMLAVEGREPPVRTGTEPPARPVRVMTVQPVDVVPRAIGYGEVVPAREWQAVAEVSARIVWMHPDLERGAILAEGTELLRFDPADYDLARQQAEASLAEIDARAGNTRASLGIEERSLEVLRRDLERKRDLRRTGAIAQSAVDDAERAVLAGEQQMQSLRNTLALIPSQRRVVETQAETARLNLERTTLRAPFDIRVREVSVEQGQFAQRGQVVARADGIERAEVSAQVPLDRLFPLIPEAEAPMGPEVAATAARLPALLALDAVVRLNTGDRAIEWPGRVVRIAETVDPKTRTLGVIVAVDDPYGRAQPGVRPPLTRGMFVEVELRGPAREDRIVIPRDALHPGRTAYVVTAEDRLALRPVAIAWTQGDIAVVEDGLAAGDRLVLTDLIPAVEGMRLAPEEDTPAAAALVGTAGDAGAAR